MTTIKKTHLRAAIASLAKARLLQPVAGQTNAYSMPLANPRKR